MLYLILKSCGKVPSSWLHTCWTHGTSMIWAFPVLLLSMFLWTQFYSYKCLQGESERCCNATKPSLFSCKNLWILFVVSTQFWFQLPPPGKISRKERRERVFWRLIQDYLHNKEEKGINFYSWESSVDNAQRHRTKPTYSPLGLFPLCCQHLLFVFLLLSNSGLP